MNQPDYKDMRLRMLSEIETACRKCGNRYVDAGGKVQCKRPDCPTHSVREKALSIIPTAFQLQS